MYGRNWIKAEANVAVAHRCLRGAVYLLRINDEHAIAQECEYVAERLAEISHELAHLTRTHVPTAND